MKNILIAAVILGVAWYGKKVYDQTMYTIQEVTGSSSVQEDRTLSAFTGIASYIGADVEWRKGEVHSVQIDAPSEVVPQIRTRVEGDMLEIKTDNDVSFGNQRIVIRITSPDLRRVHMMGSGDFVAKSPITRSNFDTNLGGSGSITAEELDVENFDANLGGSGSITIGGKTTNSNIALGGSGTFEGKKLRSARCTANLAGSGTIYCRVEDRLEANLVGSGDIIYYGNPKVEANKIGSGDIEKGSL
jgi:hypothetical protein